MRKVAIAVVVLLGLAAAATPLAGGLQARRTHARLVENLGAVESSTQGLVRIVEQDFTLGWLRSAARTRVQIGPPGAGWSFTLLHSIQHGPVPIGHIARTPSLSVIETVEETGLLRGETTVDLEGGLSSDLSGQAGAWEGASARARVMDQGRRVAVEVSAPRLELQRDSGTLAVESASAAYTSEQVRTGLLRTLKGSLKRARMVRGESGAATSIEDLAWSSSTSEEAERARIAGDFGLAALELEGRRYADARVHFELRDVDAAALATLDALRLRAAQSALEGQPLPQLADTLWNNLLARLPTLLASPAQVDLSAAHVETPEGGIDLDLRIRFDGAAATRAIEILQVQGRVAVPPSVFAVLMQLGAALAAPGASQANDTATLAYLASGLGDQLVGQRYVVQEDDGQLATDLVYARGQLSLNGGALDLQALFGQATQDQVH